jgi:Ca2+-binding RTX toxin-like protein
MVEPLEGRLLLSVSFYDSDAIAVRGTAADDEIVLLTRGNQIVIRENGRASRIDASKVRTIHVYGQDGNDRIDARRLVATPAFLFVGLHGEAGDDRLESASGGEVSSVLFGGTGDDRLRAWGGRSAFLSGQRGNDLIVNLTAGEMHAHGGFGSDRIFGGPGPDRLDAGELKITDDHAADVLDGGEGYDVVEYDSEADVYLRAERVQRPGDARPPRYVPRIWVRPAESGSEWVATVAMRLSGPRRFIVFGAVERDGNRIHLPVSADGPGSRIHNAATVLGSTSLGELPPGEYTVEVVGQDGQTLAERTIRVRSR